MEELGPIEDCGAHHDGGDIPDDDIQFGADKDIDQPGAEVEAGKTFWGEKKEVSREAEGAAIKEWLSTLVVTPSPSPTPPPHIPEREDSISETFVPMIYSRSFNIIFYVVTSQSSLQQSNNS